MWSRSRFIYINDAKSLIRILEGKWAQERDKDPCTAASD